MMNKRILLAGMAAALSISAAGVPAYAATTQQNQSTIEQNGEKPSDDQKPADGQLGRKSDEEAMKEGNPTPDLPDGVTTDDFDAPMDRPDGDGTQRPAGDDTQTPPEKPSDDDDGKGPQGGQQGEPGRKSDEDAMKEENEKPDLPQGVTVDGSDNVA